MRGTRSVGQDENEFQNCSHTQSRYVQCFQHRKGRQIWFQPDPLFQESALEKCVDSSGTGGDGQGGGGCAAREKVRFQWTRRNVTRKRFGRIVWWHTGAAGAALHQQAGEQASLLCSNFILIVLHKMSSSRKLIQWRRRSRMDSKQPDILNSVDLGIYRQFSSRLSYKPQFLEVPNEQVQTH